MSSAIEVLKERVKKYPSNWVQDERQPIHFFKTKEQLADEEAIVALEQK